MQITRHLPEFLFRIYASESVQIQIGKKARNLHSVRKQGPKTLKCKNGENKKGRPKTSFIRTAPMM